MRTWLALAALLALPLAAAQNESTDDLPVGVGAPGPEESTEGAPGFSYGALVLLGTLIFAVALGIAARSYRRNRPPGSP